MHRPRVGYNDKARGSTTGGKKKRKRRHQPSAVASLEKLEVDPNVMIHLPKTKEERDLERKERVKQEVAAQSDSKMNSKKKKRLEKYIEKKLKKEERVVLFEKLSKSQSQLSTTLHLQSSSTLGTGKASTNKERLEKLEDKETRRAIEGRAGKRKRDADKYDVLQAKNDYNNSEEEEHMEMCRVETTTVSTVTDNAQTTVVLDSVETSVPQFVASPSSAVGSALRRNPDGSVVAPRIAQKKRPGKKATFSSWNLKPGLLTKSLPEEASDTSFDSSDSAYDSDKDDHNSELRGQDTDDIGIHDEEQLENAPLATKKRLGFKDWARQQLSVAKGYATTQDAQNSDPDKSMSLPPPAKKQKTDHASRPAEMRGPLGEDFQLPSTLLTEHLRRSKPFKAVTVVRPAEIVEARLLLPIVTEEQPIMEAILLNHVVIICGETGSGKTTQVPQFLYEAGFGNPATDNPGMIGITQPRRVAAMSMANRVAYELSLTSSRVSYQIRYDATVSPSTSIKFMTDGVLLRELATDFLLSKYSVIVIDEAHERSMNTDILIGVLSRVLKLREQLWNEGKDDTKPLRLIIMSATLRVSDFAENQRLFISPPPVINIAARQHPVTVHFNRRTPSDYVAEAIKKASKIHIRLPPGGILIFLTGQTEIIGVCRKLAAKFGQKALEARRQQRRATESRSTGEEQERIHVIASAHADIEAEDVELSNNDDDLAVDVDEGILDEDPEALDSDDEQTGENVELGIETAEAETPMHIVPLYSLLPSDKQMRVFQSPPAGHRLVVVSTNVAETSLTIPGIRYVVDCGRSKERRYDVANDIQAFQVGWISKASASQRAGRAGRTGPGHCYRLYSSALFEHYFDAFSQPEILRMPIEGVVLQMKSMHIDAVVNFPFPTPPDQFALKKAETVLTYLGAISVPPTFQKGSAEVLTTGTFGGHITNLGKSMSLFPLAPRFSRMLVAGRQHGCLPYIVSIVAALSVGDPFLREEGIDDGREELDDDVDEALSHLHNEAAKIKEVRKLRRRAFFQSQQNHASLGNRTSDMFRLLSVVGAYEYAGGGQKFCSEHFVRPKVMEEIHKLRAQISSIVQTNFPSLDASFVPNLQPPDDLQLRVLKQLLTAAFINQVAIRKDLTQRDSFAGIRYATSRGVQYQAMGILEDVYIHPSSVLADVPPPEYIVYHEVVRTNRIWLKGLTVINPAWLSSLGKPTLCTFSKPVKNSAGVQMVIPRFGPERWELPPLRVDR